MAEDIYGTIHTLYTKLHSIATYGAVHVSYHTARKYNAVLIGQFVIRGNHQIKIPIFNTSHPTDS